MVELSDILFLSPDLTLAQSGAAPPVAGDGGAALQPSTQGADPGLGPNGQQQPVSPFGGQFLIIMMLFLGVMILLPALSGRKQKKQRAAMLSSLARHDRVQTMGGMIGTIAEIKDGEVVLKVDEATNTKIRFSRGAIQQVIKKAGEKTDAAPVEAPEMASVG